LIESTRVNFWMNVDFSANSLKTVIHPFFDDPGSKQ
jgi:hypothetical protein